MQPVLRPGVGGWCVGGGARDMRFGGAPHMLFAQCMSMPGRLLLASWPACPAAPESSLPVRRQCQYRIPNPPPPPPPHPARPHPPHFTHRRSDEREYNADRESLNRMIADFKEDVERNSRSASGLPFVLPWVTGGGDSGSGRAEGAAAASPPAEQQQDVAAGGQGEGGAAAAGSGGSGGGEGLEEVRPSDDEAPGSSSPSCVAVEPVGRRSSRRAVVDHEGIEIVMRAYEEAIKNPIKGVATGQLPRTLLIQVGLRGWPACRLVARRGHIRETVEPGMCFPISACSCSAHCFPPVAAHTAPPAALS